MDPRDLLYKLFPLMGKLASDASFPDKPSKTEDMDWVLRLINNGVIRKANGEAFPAGMSYEEITRMMLHEAKHSEDMVELPDKKKKATQMLLVETDGGYKTVAIDFTFDKSMKCEGVSEGQPVAGKSAANPQINSRIFADVYDMANDLWNELDENEPLFFKGSKQYFDMKNALSAFLDSFDNYIKPYEQKVSMEQLSNMLQPVLAHANTYVNAKLDGKELDSRQFDRLRVCKNIQSLGKRIAEAAEAEKEYNDAAEGEAKSAAEKKLKAAQNSLRPYELLKDKVANDMVFGTMKTKGLKVAQDVLNKQRVAEMSIYSKVGIYDDMFTKLRKSDDFKAVICETAQAGKLPYGQNVAALKKFAQKKPGYLVEKLAERRQKAGKEAIFRSDAISKQPKTEDEIKEILDNVQKLGNPVLYTVCQTTLNMTNRMVKDLADADGTSIHSDAYKRFRSELRIIHEHLLNDISVDAGMSKDAQNDILKDMCADFRKLVSAAQDYQTEHMDKTFETAGVKITNRLKVATGVQVLNDFLTNEDNQQRILNRDESVIDKMGQEIAAFRDFCKKTEDFGIGTLLNYNSSYKSSVPPVSPDSNFLRDDEWGQCFGMNQTIAERKAAEQKAREHRLDTLKANYEKAIAETEVSQKALRAMKKRFNEAPEIIGPFKEDWEKKLKENNGQASKDDIKKAYDFLYKNLKVEYSDFDIYAVEMGELARSIREQIKAHPGEEFNSIDTHLKGMENAAKAAGERLEKFPKISKEDSWMLGQKAYELAGFNTKTAEPLKKPEAVRNAEPVNNDKRPDSEAYNELYVKQSSAEDLYLK